LKIIDSCSFIKLPLHKFPSTFNIVENKKGFFPFKLIQHGYSSSKYPAKEFYQPGFMSKSRKKEFDIWYEKVKDEKFDFEKEFIDYCSSDVDLLLHGCLRFRKIILENENLDPFQTCITIASLCNHIYRKNYMPENSIAVIPENGFFSQQIHSKISLLWLKYISNLFEINIQHARNSKGEFRIGKYYVDGYCEETNTIYEFHGCYFHGCPRCYPHNSFNSHKNVLQSTVHYYHKKRIEEIKQAMPNVILNELWECDLRIFAKFDENFKSFLDNNHIEERLQPRDALFGGRTNAVKLHHICKDEEKIKYIDFTSLYPSVQKYCEYPIGFPEIITENFNFDSKKYFGLIKCEILAPRKLFLPVLPVRNNGKLCFTNCLRCAQELSKEECKCSNEQRMLKGTWVSLEIYKAIEKGYKICKIFEIWHWPETSKYDPISKKGGIFTDYINKALKRKQEASGWPKENMSENEKASYIEEYFEHEGIKLDYDKIENNPGLRAIAKLMLNSQWGYLAMRENKIKHEFVSSVSKFYNIVTDNSNVVQNIDFKNKNFIQIFYKKTETNCPTNPMTNVCVANFVTAHARLKLYSELEKLEYRVLYFDTDSIIYISKPGCYDPKMGTFLGDFTSEVPTYIKHFVSLGPKNYGFITAENVQKIIVKGITLHEISSFQINFDEMQNILLNDLTKNIKIDQLSFKRDKKTWSVMTEIIEKNYRLVYDKRFCFIYNKERLNDFNFNDQIDCFSSIPYGY
jgi:hypothetical protein